MRRSVRLSLVLGAVLAASSAFAASKDSVTIGMALEPPGLDPTTGAAAAIGEITHYNIFEGLDQDQRATSRVTPLLAEKLDAFARFEDADLQAEEGRQFPGRRSVFLQGRQVLVRALRGQGFHQQGEGVLRLDRVDRRCRPLRRRARHSSSRASTRCSISAMNTAVILDEKSAAADGDAIRSAPDPTSSPSWTKGSSVTLEKWDGFRERRQNRDRAGDVQVHQRSLRRGRRAARRRRRRLSPRRGAELSRNSRATRASRSRSAAPRARRSSASTTRRSRSTTSECAGARLCGRPQGDHRRRR